MSTGAELHLTLGGGAGAMHAVSALHVWRLLHHRPPNATLDHQAVLCWSGQPILMGDAVQPGATSRQTVQHLPISEIQLSTSPHPGVVINNTLETSDWPFQRLVWGLDISTEPNIWWVHWAWYVAIVSALMWFRFGTNRPNLIQDLDMALLWRKPVVINILLWILIGLIHCTMVTHLFKGFTTLWNGFICCSYSLQLQLQKFWMGFLFI